jgi:metal-responsive CopG/Arc/MetJ family transcriptional regulator
MPDRPLPPRLSDTVKRVNLVIPGELLARLDAYRRDLPGLPNRSIALRQLIEQALEAVEKKPKGKGKPKD